MPDNQESNERDDEIDRKLRSLNLRVERLEDTQITGRELNRGFNRVYEEIDHLEDKVDRLQPVGWVEETKPHFDFVFLAVLFCVN